MMHDAPVTCVVPGVSGEYAYEAARRFLGVPFAGLTSHHVLCLYIVTIQLRA